MLPLQGRGHWFESSIAHSSSYSHFGNSVNFLPSARGLAKAGRSWRKETQKMLKGATKKSYWVRTPPHSSWLFRKKHFFAFSHHKDKEVRCVHGRRGDKRRPPYVSKRYFTVTSYGLLRLLQGPSAWHGLLMTCPAWQHSVNNGGRIPRFKEHSLGI